MKKISLFITLLIISLSTFAQVVIPADSLKKHVYFLASDSLEGRGLSTQSGLQAANYIASYFKQFGIKPVGEKYLHPFYYRMGQTMLTGNNVVGLIEGSDPDLKNEYIVLGAHFDHISFKFINGKKVIYNGADDNATGTAAVIELARALAKHQGELKRSIVIVAFDGEESGLIGSGEFIKQNIVEATDIKLMMSIDMIGRYKESNSLIMGAMGTLTDGEDLLDEIAKKHDIKIKRTGTEVSNRTDSKPFGDIGIPALHVTSGITGPYHKPADDRETIDYKGMEKISGLLYELTFVLANQESLEPSVKFIADKERIGVPIFRVGAKVNIGRSFHAYPNDYYNGKGKFSYELGLMTQLKLNNSFSLQPEILYSSLASEYKTGNFREHSITTPVSLVMATSFDEEMNQRFYATFGGYYRYHFYGSANKTALDFTNSYEQTETGIVFGLGLEIMSVHINANYNLGLSNLAKSNVGSEFKNRALYFSMGYMF